MPAHTPGAADELLLHLMVLRCQSGDERAFAQLFDRFGGRTNPSGDAWGMIEREKRRDRFIRKVSFTAWTATFVIALAFTIMVGANVAQMAEAARVGAVPWSAVFGMAMPLIIVLGFLSLLIATLSTVGVFLRLRTASLAEIQPRLAALEEMLAARPDSKIS